MEVLRAMEEEFKAVEKDIKEHPEHVGDYNLFGMVKEIKKRSNICILKEVENICANNENSNFCKNISELVE